MVDNSTSLSKPISGRFFVMRQSSWAFSSQSKVPSELFCGYLQRLPRDMTLLSHEACVALNRKPTARGTRAPRAPSIVVWFCRLPWLGCAGGLVALAVCPLVLEAAEALSAARHEDAQNGSTRATTRGEPVAVEPVGKWPRSVLREPPRHGARSVEPAQ
jgi:hypothetical protein